MKRVVILGGGSGGPIAAKRLARAAHPGEFEVVLIDRSPWHEYRPSYLWVMTGLREPDDVRRPLDLLEKRFGTKVVLAEVTKIVPDRNVVETSEGSYEYDFLIVSLGSAVEDAPAVHGMEAPWELDASVEARRRIAEFKGGNIVVAPSSIHRCPPAPFEVGFMMRYLSEQRGIADKTKVSVAALASKPMESFGPLMIEGFTGFLRRFDVDFVPSFTVAANDRDAGVIRSTDGRELPYDLAFLVPPHKAPDVVSHSPLAADTGYMDVTLPNLRSPKYPNVFGVGDVVAPTLDLGMAGVFAHLQADHVASQIIDSVRGVYMGELYNMVGICVMDTGYMGAGVWCDFTDKMNGRSTYPDCRMLGGMRAFRGLKAAFEKWWFASIFGS